MGAQKALSMDGILNWLSRRKPCDIRSSGENFGPSIMVSTQTIVQTQVKITRPRKIRNLLAIKVEEKLHEDTHFDRAGLPTSENSWLWQIPNLVALWGVVQTSSKAWLLSHCPDTVGLFKRYSLRTASNLTHGSATVMFRRQSAGVLKQSAE